jgi:hypothetical protein
MDSLNRGLLPTPLRAERSIVCDEIVDLPD